MKFKSKAFATAAVLFILTNFANPALAASAGRIGGSSFGSSRSSGGGFGSSRSYSAPKSSYTPRSYSAPSLPSYTPRRSSGGTNVIVVPDFHPVYVPIGGGSSSGTPTAVANPGPPPSPAFFFTLLTLLGIGGIALFLAFGGWDDFVSPWLEIQRERLRKLTLVRVNVALLASAKDIQQDLEKIARRRSPDQQEFLRKALSETSLGILRNKDKVVYAWGESQKGSSGKIEDMFNEALIQERSKASKEVITNIEGIVSESPSDGKSGEKPPEYILVSIVLATNKELALQKVTGMESLVQNLTEIGSLGGTQIIGLEILWQPENERDSLSKEDLLTLYPSLAPM